ncbi:MAG TPA: phosphorylase [Bacteroidales bacterium]|nr:phosphorylase [Bacteroidales bacterium]
MKQLLNSELIINSDGSIYHLAIKPEDIADTIILVGDQNRVGVVSSFFDEILVKKQNREFVTHTGIYNGKKISVISTGIGTDNIDIVLNELDALVNIDLKERVIKDTHRSLRFIRLGTSGGLQQSVPVDTFLLTEKVLGFDGMLNFYADIESITDMSFEKAFVDYVNWNPRLGKPYVVDASPALVKLFEEKTYKGVTISAPGFYGPQGRKLRLDIYDPDINEKITRFAYNHYKITNYEMESSALFGLSKMLGHEAVTICVIIANRVSRTYSKDYHPIVKQLIKYTLDKLTQ